MEKEVIEMRVVPYVRIETIIKNGKEHHVKVDNLSTDEIRKMSVKMPKILEKNSEGIYVLDETSVTFRGTGLRMLLCFDFTELTEEEQLKYFSRSIVVPVIVKTGEKVVAKAKKKIKNKNNRSN